MVKRRLAVVATIVALLCGSFYLCCGLFVVHPLSTLREGSTYVYWRVGTNLPFIASADGLLIEQAEAGKVRSGAQRSRSITPEARGEALGAMTDLVLKRRILKLPYWRQIYLISTGGKELDR